jgi:hypothetical protein
VVCVLSFDPTNNVPFFFLYTTRESKKCTNFENIVNPSSNNVIIKLMKIKKFIKYLHNKSTFSIDVQVVNINS